MSVKITVCPDGPLMVEGEVEVIGVDGQPKATKAPKFALCRCGASNNKPFCDGQHRKIGFCDKAAAAGV